MQVVVNDINDINISTNTYRAWINDTSDIIRARPTNRLSAIARPRPALAHGDSLETVMVFYARPLNGLQVRIQISQSREPLG